VPSASETTELCRSSAGASFRRSTARRIRNRDSRTGERPSFAAKPRPPSHLSEVGSSVGLARIRFHDLRHTFATIALGRGVHPKIVSEMLGHSTVAITLDLYSHVTPTMQRETAAIFDRVLSGGAR